MMNAIRRVSVAAVTCGLVIGSALTPAHAASSSGWRLAYRSHSRYEALLTSVTAPSRSDAWATGVTDYPHGVTRPVIVHWNGSSWRRVTPKVPGLSGFEPSQVEASSAGNVWFFGVTTSHADEALIWNGRAWRFVALPLFAGDGSALVLGPGNVWIAGGTTCGASLATCASTVCHWSGSSWTCSQLAGGVLGLSGGNGHAWLLALEDLKEPSLAQFSGHPVVYRWSGSQWRPLPALPPYRAGMFSGIAASPRGSVWVYTSPAGQRGRPRLAHLTRAGWQVRKVPSRISARFQIHYDGRRGVWAGPYAHWTGRRWVDTSNLSGLGPHSVALDFVAPIPGSASIWAVGGINAPTRKLVWDSLIAVHGRLP